MPPQFTFTLRCNAVFFFAPLVCCRQMHHGELRECMNHRSSWSPLLDAFLQKLTDNIVIRSNHRGPSNLCYFSEDKLREVLALNHSCGLGDQRYYVQGSWINWDSLYWEFEKPRDQSQSDYVEGESDCILACKDDPSLNCSAEIPCLHAFYLRRNSTGKQG